MATVLLLALCGMALASTGKRQPLRRTTSMVNLFAPEPQGTASTNQGQPLQHATLLMNLFAPVLQRTTSVYGNIFVDKRGTPRSEEALDNKHRLPCLENPPGEAEDTLKPSGSLMPPPSGCPAIVVVRVEQYDYNGYVRGSRTVLTRPNKGRYGMLRKGSLIRFVVARSRQSHQMVVGSVKVCNTMDELDSEETPRLGANEVFVLLYNPELVNS